VIGTEQCAPLLRQLAKDRRYLGYRLSGRYQQEMTEAFFRDLALTAELGKSVDFLVGGYTLKDIDAIAKRLPNLRIILDHFGNVRLDGKALDPAWVADFRAVAKHPNVYCKVSALYGRFVKQPAPRELAVYRPILDLAYESFGEDRLVFGSDWPVSESTADYAALLALTREYFAPKGAEVNQKLFHRNAVKFYAIPAVK
jgi:L-fuconolactonase